MSFMEVVVVRFFVFLFIIERVLLFNVFFVEFYGFV